MSRAVGAQVERAAEQFFLSRYPQGVLIERNYLTRLGEIDLVFERPTHQGIELVFIEVRMRSLGGWETGIESVRPQKRRKLQKTVSHFLSHYSGRADHIQFDVLSWDGACWEAYEHLEGVWE